MPRKETEKKKELVWNVYIGNFNAQCIEVFNIFHHVRFFADLKKIAKKYKNDREMFEEEVRRNLMYYYWSKCEWEIILTGWPQREGYNDEKVDVYSQVMLNWDVFIDYLWENRGALK